MKTPPWLNTQIVSNGQSVQANFLDWFSGSCVLDPDDQPQVLFHNTAGNVVIDEFQTSKELGAHFGEIEQANERGPGLHRQTMPVYLCIKNPLRLEDRGDFEPENIIEQLVDLGITPKDGSGYPHGTTSDQIKAVIQSHGYDGVIYLNRREIPGAFGPDGMDGDELNSLSDEEVMDYFGDDAKDSWIAFEPEQIKSALGNSGLFLKGSASLSDSVAAEMLSSGLRASEMMKAVSAPPKPKRRKNQASVA